MRWLGYVATILWWSGIARSLSALNRGQSYKISPKPCRGPGPDGDEGTCMFVWECIKSEGSHVGVCMDTFMFGSCCIHNTTTNNVNSELGALPNTPRPSLAEALSDEPMRHISSSPRPHGHPEGSSTSPNGIASSKPHRPNTQRPRPTMGGLGPGRPGQKRPQAKPSNTGDQNYASKNHPEKLELGQDQQSLEAHAYSTTTTHDTLLVKLPSRGPNQTARPQRPGNGQKPSESRPNDGKPDDLDLVVQATMHRPNVDANGQKVAESVQHQNPNFIHTEPPKWATKPAGSHKPSTEYSKPYFSIKTTTQRPVTLVSHGKDKPSFVSKPSQSYVPTTASKPAYYSSHTTGTAGSTQQTVQWQATTEPAFVTKHKTSTSRPPTIIESTKPVSSNSHVWSENSWTPPKPSLKPHWTDNPAWMNGGSETFHPKPMRPTKPNQPHESTEYERPLGSAHYITTSYMETSTKSRPTKKTSTTTTTTSTTTTTTTTTTTEKPSTRNPVPTTISTTASPLTSKTTGSVLTVSANTAEKDGQCGVPPLFPRPETRIVGGKDAPFGRWPWQVSVRRTSFFGFGSTHRCGGAVLNENWIATAGHCVDDLLTSQIRIRVGEYDFSSIQERYPFVERAVSRKVVHPMYNFFTYEYDLALVRLETSLIFAPHISPICLPATDDLLIGENATVTGWGRLSEGGTLPSVLQEVSVPIVSNEKCKSMFLAAGRHEFIPEIFLCAGHEAGGQDSCQGDSGGPLQVRGKDGRYFLAGIISWGIGCAAANLPGVCTRISKFVPWILKNVT